MPNSPDFTQQLSNVGVVLWDKDGVLVDSAHSILGYVTNNLQLLGFSLNDWITYEEVLQFVKTQLPNREEDDLIEELFSATVLNGAEAYPGMDQLVELISRAGILQAIITARPQKQHDATLKAAAKFFNSIPAQNIHSRPDNTRTFEHKLNRIKQYLAQHPDQPTVFVDDKWETIDALAQENLPNLTLVLLDRPWNQNYRPQNGVVRQTSEELQANFQQALHNRSSR